MIHFFRSELTLATDFETFHWKVAKLRWFNLNITLDSRYKFISELEDCIRFHKISGRRLIVQLASTAAPNNATAWERKYHNVSRGSQELLWSVSSAKNGFLGWGPLGQHWIQDPRLIYVSDRKTLREQNTRLEQWRKSLERATAPYGPLRYAIQLRDAPFNSSTRVEEIENQPNDVSFISGLWSVANRVDAIFEYYLQTAIRTSTSGYTRRCLHRNKHGSMPPQGQCEQP